MKIKALLIDDEPHAREGIKIRLEEYEKIDVVGECSSGTEALEAINSLKPDILFLDIQMPEMNGFEVIQNITISPLPFVIFVTAYDSYALKAFEVHALDYLLKPISDDRFINACNNAITMLEHRDFEIYAGQLKKMIKQYNKENQPETADDEKEIPLKKLLVKIRDNILVISPEQVEWIESAGDYVYIHHENKKHILRESLSSLEEKLDSSKFVRIHRSAIVNIDFVLKLKPANHGDYDVFLKNSHKLKLSRTYRDTFQKVIGNLI